MGKTVGKRFSRSVKDVCHLKCFQLLVLLKQNPLSVDAAWFCEKCSLAVYERGGKWGPRNISSAGGDWQIRDIGWESNWRGCHASFGELPIVLLNFFLVCSWLENRHLKGDIYSLHVIYRSISCRILLLLFYRYILSA